MLFTESVPAFVRVTCHYRGWSPVRHARISLTLSLAFSNLDEGYAVPHGERSFAPCGSHDHVLVVLDKAHSLLLKDIRRADTGVVAYEAFNVIRIFSGLWC